MMLLLWLRVICIVIICKFSIGIQPKGILFGIYFKGDRGWSGSAMALGKLPVLGPATNLDWSRAWAYCTCSRCGWGLFGYFFYRLSFLISFSLSLGDGPI